MAVTNSGPHWWHLGILTGRGFHRSQWQTSSMKFYGVVNRLTRLTQWLPEATTLSRPRGHPPPNRNWEPIAYLRVYPLTFYTEITSALALPHGYPPPQQTKYSTHRQSRKVCHWVTVCWYLNTMYTDLSSYRISKLPLLTPIAYPFNLVLIVFSFNTTTHSGCVF